MKITYYLGAGASYNSMPLVNTFLSRFKKFTTITTNITALNQSTMVADIKQFELEVAGHYSFDTFFKKLFHTGRTNEILMYKQILALYFLCEQFYDIYDRKLVEYRSKFDNTPTKQSIDVRYDALIASLLLPIEGLKFMADVSIVTWNYDLCLVNSIANFYGDPAFGMYFEGMKKSNSCSFDQLSVMNMNGSIYTNRIKNTGQLDYEKIKEFITLMSQSYGQNFGELYEASELISFAWEQKNSNLVDQVIERIKESDYIVVIGYTFPIYNRLIDSRIFTTDSLKHKKVVIQDPLASKILENFKFNFKLSEDEIEVYRIELMPVEDCSMFHIPSSLY